MSTYREIVGKKIKKVSSDPSSGLDGEMWYNSTTGTLRGLGVVEAFSSAASLSTGRYNLTGVGTDTAGLVFGGDTGPPPETRRAESEEYNGSGWTTTPNMNTTRDLTGGFGIQTAAATAGGRPPSAPGGSNNTEEYNGSSWTAVPGTLNTTRFGAGGFGTQTAGAVCGGTPPTTNATEEYDGSSWTSVNNMNSSVSSLQSATAGTQTAAIRVAGYPNNNTIELYDGTNWTTSPGSLNTARFSGSYQGSQTAGFYAGGQLFPPNAASAATETWDGTSMTTSPATLALIQYYHTGSKGSPSTSGWVCGGQTPAATNNTSTQEYNKSTNTITAAAWASGGTMNTGRTALGGTGITTAALGMGGGAPLNVQTEEYDGSSWTSTNNINTGRAIYGGAFGPQGAAGAASGEPTSTPAGSSYEEYDGSNWTAGPSLNIARNGGISLGTQTAALCVAGFTGPAAPNSYIKTSESWNGSSWTSLPSPGSDTQTAGSGSSAGTTTAGLIFGRYDGAPNYTGKTDEYDGSSWTVGGVMITARYAAAGSGAQTAAMVSQGYSTGTLNVAEGYDGSVWSTRPNCSVGKYQVAGAGASNTDCINFGGSGNSSATEEFTGETETANITNFTTS